MTKRSIRMIRADLFHILTAVGLGTCKSQGKYKMFDKSSCITLLEQCASVLLVVIGKCGCGKGLWMVSSPLGWVWSVLFLPLVVQNIKGCEISKGTCYSRINQMLSFKFVFILVIDVQRKDITQYKLLFQILSLKDIFG